MIKVKTFSWESSWDADEEIQKWLDEMSNIKIISVNLSTDRYSRYTQIFYEEYDQNDLLQSIDR